MAFVIPTKDVALAGETYAVTALPARRADAWRERFEGAFSGVVDMLRGIGVYDEKKEGADRPAFMATFAQQLDVGEALGTLQSTFVHSPKTVRELMFAFSPALEADRERLEEEAYDEEFLSGFFVILKLAYPLDKLTAMFGGLAAVTTSTNSPSANGAATPTPRGRMRPIYEP